MSATEVDTLFFRAELTLAMARLYDLQVALLAEQNPERAAQILAQHEAGGFWYPALFKRTAQTDIKDEDVQRPS